MNLVERLVSTEDAICVYRKSSLFELHDQIELPSLVWIQGHEKDAVVIAGFSTPDS